MSKTRKIVRCLLGGCLLVLGIVSAVAAASDEAPAQVAETLKKTYPKLEFQKIFTSPIAGLYEVAAGGKILYFAPKTGHMLAGELWTKDSVNLSKERLGKLMGEKLKLLPLNKAIKIGTGKNTVIEVTDPDCIFCRKGSDFFAQRKDVTRYIFFLPLKMHPQAEQKARYVLSAADPASAYEEVMSGRYDEGPIPFFKDNGVIESHKEATALLGLNGTPNYWINGTFVAGANIKAIERLLK
ncbi:DsbC family protein [Trichloromonas sp.]|uniref:DsbC family protein n=1 Tax=Trichloromonas sp. TaxID=3069249 RepID=UPI002A47850B|nr:DsbC family protein [Trichloromonas sp.]